MIPTAGDTVYFRGHPNKGGWRVVSVEQFRAGLVQVGSTLEAPYFYAPLTDLSAEEWGENKRKLAEEAAPPERETALAGPPPPPHAETQHTQYNPAEVAVTGDEDGNMETEQPVADPPAGGDTAGSKRPPGKR